MNFRYDLDISFYSAFSLNIYNCRLVNKSETLLPHCPCILNASCFTMLCRDVMDESSRSEELESIKANPEPTDTLDSTPCSV